MRSFFSWFVFLCAQTLVRTLRVHRIGPPITDPSVVAFWHGDQLPLLRARPPGRESVPVSLSRDGELQTKVLGYCGMNVIRGSSSRGGVSAARRLIACLSRGDVVLIAADGPRGPRQRVKPGAVYLARKTETPIFPVAVATEAAFHLSRSWDRFVIPRPFSRVCVWVGEPWHPAEGVSLQASCLALEKIMHQGELQAREGLTVGFS